MTHSKGISWIDDCRIPFVDDGDKEESYRKPLDTIREGFVKTTKPEYRISQGRFPANLLVCDDMLNDGVISKSVKVKSPLLDITGGSYGNHKGNTDKITDRGFNDKGSNSRYYDIDKWFDKIINYE
jgi:hypothetical protein